MSSHVLRQNTSQGNWEVFCPHIWGQPLSQRFPQIGWAGADQFRLMETELNADSRGLSRRALLRRGLTVLGVASIAPVLSACEVPFLSSGAEAFEMPAETPEEAITRLLEGNARFVRGKSTTINESAERRTKIAQRQRPFATIFSCVDSRVPPELVFDRGLGDLFVIRTAGNVVDSAVMGSLEYGAYELEIPLLLVLGHKGCGAVKATMETIESGGKAEGSIAYLVEAIRPAIETPKAEVLGLVLTETEAVTAPKEAMVVGDGGAPKASAQPPKAAMTPSLPAATPAVSAVAPTGETATAEPTSPAEAVAEPDSSVPAAPDALATEETLASEETLSEESVAEDAVAEDAVAEETLAEEGATDESGEAGDPLTDAIKRNVVLTVARLMKSPIIAERVGKDRLRVVGALYDLETGIVELTENVPKEFLPAGSEDTEA